MSGPKGSPRPAGLWLRENLENHIKEEKQMTVTLCPGAPSGMSWETLPWQRIKAHVLRLQMRIAKVSFQEAGSFAKKGLSKA